MLQPRPSDLSCLWSPKASTVPHINAQPPFLLYSFLFHTCILLANRAINFWGQGRYPIRNMCIRSTLWLKSVTLESDRLRSNPSFPSYQLCGLGQVPWSLPVWFHQLSNEDNNSTLLTGLAWGLNSITCVKILAQCLACECSMMLTIKILSTELKAPSIYVPFLLKWIRTKQKHQIACHYNS